MKAIYSALFAFIDAKSGLHTFLGGLLGLSMLGIGLKQHSTAGEVAKVVDATVPDAPK